MTGFNNPVGQVTVGGTVAVTNPQDLASAIFTTGVPQIMSETVLVNLPGIFTLAAGNFLVVNNINVYASLIVTINCANNAAIRCDFDGNATFNGIDYLFSEYYTMFGTPNEPSTWVVPINAGSMRIYNTGASDINLIVVGTNRLIPAASQLGKNQLPRKFGYSGALTSGTPTVLTSSDADTSPYSRFNREVFIRAAVSGGAAGLIGYQYIAQNGAIVVNYVTSLAAGANSFITIGHPGVPCRWVLLPSATNTGAISLDITPFST